MKKTLAILVLIAGLVHTANAGTSEYVCQSTQGVGIKNGELTRIFPATFFLTRFRDGRMGLYVATESVEKTMIGAGTQEDETQNDAFMQIVLLDLGSYFTLNLSNLRFSFSASLGYLLPNQNLPHMFVGICKKTRA